MKKRLLSLALVLCMVLTLMPMAAFAAEVICPTGVELPESITISKFSVHTLTPVLFPKNATTSLSWKSSDPNIVEVHSAGIGDSGNIIGVSAGRAIVTVNTSNGYSSSILVAVQDVVEPTYIKLGTSYAVDVGEKKYIDVEMGPSGATTLFRIISDDPTVASTFTGGGGLSISKDGISAYYASSVGIEGLKAGTTTFTIETINGVRATSTVTVREGIRPTAIIIPEKFQIVEGGQWDIPIELEPADAKTQYSIQTDDNTVIRVATTGARSGCRVYGVNVGNATVTVFTNNGLPAKCKIEVVHDWNELPTIDADPTCAEGRQSIHCKVCNATKCVEVIDPMYEHQWNTFYTIDEAPTCEKEGRKSIHCSVCGAASDHQEVVPATGHHYTDAVTAPTCTAQGYTTHTCTCGDSYVDSYTNALGHSFGEWTVTTAPTCTEKGVETRYCSRCDATETRDVDALGHSFGEWTVTTAPTCTEKGVETRHCSRCDVTETREVDALGHDLVHHDGKAAACTEAGWEAYDTCSRCDYTTYKEISALGHDYKDGVCTVCGAKDPDYKPPVVKENPFVDVSESSVYYDAILWAYYHEPQQITGGFDATHFVPGNACTRAQVVTFLWRAAGCPEPTGDTSIFKDASSIASPFRKAVAWAVEKGITAGYNDGTFRPNDPVTRAQFVTFLWRYENKPATTGSIAGFADASSIAAPYQQAVAWAVEKGITTGYNDGTFRPNATCTRWAVVLFMYRDMA